MKVKVKLKVWKSHPALLKILNTCVQDIIQYEQINYHIERILFSHINRSQVQLSETIEDYDFKGIAEITGT